MSKEIAIIFFDKMKNGLASGYHKGRVVYQHRDHEGEISMNELWICSLEEFSLSTPYFATPIQKAGISDILALDSNNAKAVADFLIRNHSEAVAEILEKTGRTSKTSVEEVMPEDDSVRYIGYDTLESARFTDGHYDVCTSIDSSTLMVIPRECGRIPCVGHRLVSEGLDQILRSETGKELTVETFDGFIVINLKREVHA